MADRPVIFSAPMVRALLAGRKTQTRRLASSPLAKAQPGDRLYVRETFYPDENGDPIYRACVDEGLAALVEHSRQTYGERWIPSIHMPRWASRLTLVVTEVRFERLQGISEGDAIAEGIEERVLDATLGWRIYEDEGKIPYPRNTSDARHSYRSLWESLHGAGSWCANPSVVAISFEVHHRNIDQLGKEAA